MKDNARIKMFVMDVDGTMTDGKINMGEKGELFKAFDIKDGYGIHEILPMNGVITVIMTGRQSKIVENRALELEITEVLQNIKDKKAALYELCKKYSITPKSVAYIGDDMIDYAPMLECGVRGCPHNAIKEIKNIADYVCRANGGDGAVREFIDWLVLRDFEEK